MTSYSIYEVHADMDGDEVVEARIETFLAGAARCLLDDTRVVPADGGDPNESEPTYAEAVWWHGPDAGWEIAAFDPDSQAALRKRAEAFVLANMADLGALTAEIERRGDSPYEDDRMWGISTGYAWYRAGMLFTYSANGAGIGFFDYKYSGGATEAAGRLQEAAERGLDGRWCGITAWCHDTEHEDNLAHIEEI